MKSSPKFNYYDSIKSNESSRTITLDELLLEIKGHNEFVPLARMFGEYYKKKNKSYDQIKTNDIPTFYPNAYNPKNRKNKSDIHEPTGFIYLDIDGFESAEATESYRWDKCYGNPYIYACWISLSGLGLSILVKADEITESNYASYWDALNEEFNGKLDKNAKGYYRQSVIPNDNEVFIFERCKSYTIDPVKLEEQYDAKPSYAKLADRQSLSGDTLDIGLEMNETPVDIGFNDPNEPFVSVDGEMVIEVNLHPNLIISEGNRYNQLSAIFSQLLYLNPTVERKRMLSYLHWVNLNFCASSLPFEQIIGIHNSIYKSYQEGNLNIDKFRVKKYVFWSKACTLDKVTKQKKAIQAKAKVHNDANAQLIYDTIEQLQNGNKITITAIAKLIDKSRETTSRIINKKYPDLKALIDTYNESLKV